MPDETKEPRDAGTVAGGDETCSGSMEAPFNHGDQAMPQIGEVHTRDGLTFRREDDGSVRVRVYPDADPDAPPVFDVTLTDAEWATVQRETSWGAVHRRPADS